jgi:stage II sporulation protein D
LDRRILFSFGIFSLLILISCAPVYLSRKAPEGEVLIRIALQRHQPSVSIYGSYSISIADKSHQASIGPGERWQITESGGRLIARTGQGTAIEGIDGRLRLWSKEEYFINDKRVKGAVEIRSEGGGGLLIITEMPLEEYLPGVLATEIGGLADKTPEAAKAQAVISRSYAFAKIGTSPRSYFDIEAGTSHQCFDFDNLISSAVKKAVKDTKGQVLTHQGKVISPNFHSTCGGRTARPSEIWNANDGDFPYLESISDKWCGISPKYIWSDTITADDITNKAFLGRAGSIRDIRIINRGVSGRILSLQISTDSGDTILTKAAVRTGMREKPLLSTLFDIDTERNAEGNLSRIILKGKGYGHGVGLCQWGAIGMARAGKGYKSILRHYYKDILIEKIY